ncbi:MAG: guanylate kinase [Thiohalomonadales bacterium]
MTAKSAASDGQLYIISAPSGAGKTSLIKALLNIDGTVSLSVSHTTRQPRPAEKDGSDYHFVSQQSFEELVRNNAFIEHAKVFENYYGTAVSSVSDALTSGNDLILEIDWQGANQVRKSFPEALGIFILPPSRQALQQRLSDRAQDDEKTIRNRMAAAISEMSHYHEFDYLIINDDFDSALAELQAILISRRLLQARKTYQQKTLLAQLIG